MKTKAKRPVHKRTARTKNHDQVFEVIRDVVKDADLTQTELATKMGTSQAYISQLLKGKNSPTLRTVSDILWACGKGFKIVPVDVKPG